MKTYRPFLLTLISSFFILLFVYAALTKLLEGDNFHTNLRNSPIMGGEAVADLAAWAIPLAELVIALLLCLPKFRLVGFYGILGLLLVFTTYTAGILFFAPYRPCSCGGVISLLSWEQHLGFNMGCILLALFGIALAHKARKKHTGMEKTELSRYPLDQNG